MTPTLRDTDIETDPGVTHTEIPGAAINEPLDFLSLELRRISAEIQSINSGFQAQMQDVLEQTRAAVEKQYQAKLATSLEGIRQQLRIVVEAELRKEFEAELQARV